MSRYFPDNENPPEEQVLRPEWAKGVALTPESVETSPKSRSAQRRDLKWVKSLAAQHTKEAIEALVECLGDEYDGRIRIQAATALLDRAWGKPAQTITGEGGGPIRVTADAEALHARLLAVAVVGTDALPPPGDAVGEGRADRALPDASSTGEAD